jgi:EmrB/QacA subfamily drug resistance transporter
MQSERNKIGRDGQLPGFAADEPLRNEALNEAGDDSGNRPWLVLAMLSVGVILAALDLTVVVAILTTMMNDLNVTLFEIDQGAWIVSAYLLAYTITMPFMGRVSDVFGRRSVFLGALLLFVIGSVGAALANTLPLMIAARTAQALGGGAMVPVSMAVVGDLFPPRRRGLALGLIGAADTAGWIIGPLYGSFMLKWFQDVKLFGDQALSWRSIFWVNVPLGLLSAVLIFFALRPGKGIRVEVRERKSIDWGGVVLLALFLTALNLALGGGKETTALSGGTDLSQLDQNPLKQYQIPLLVGAAVALLLFIFLELRVKHPLLNLRTFRRITYSAANLANFLIGGALVIGLVGIALFVNATDKSEDIIDIAFHSALALAPLTLGMAIGAVVGGWLSDRLGYRWVTIGGLLLVVAGFILMAQWNSEMRPPDALPQLFPGPGVTGLGFGIIIAPVGTAVIDSAEREDIGVAAALVLILRLIGMTVGVSILSTWALNRYDQLKPQVTDLTKLSGQDIRGPLVQVVTELFVGAAIIGAAALLPALFLRRTSAYEADLTPEELARKREVGRLL